MLQAATKGNVELVSALQAMLANKNLKDAAGSTPLHEAVTNNHYKVCSVAKFCESY